MSTIDLNYFYGIEIAGRVFGTVGVVARTPVTLTNRFAYFPDIDEATYARLNDFWSYYDPKARYAKAHRLYIQLHARAVKEGLPTDDIPGWDGKRRFFTRGAVPAGLFRATRLEIKEKLGIRFRVTKDYDDNKFPSVKAAFGPLKVREDDKYRHQAECVNAMQASIPRGGGIVLSATGTGKTKTAGDFFSLLSCQCLFVVDLVNLLYQSQAEIEKWLGEPVGVVGDSTYKIERVTCATVQTLARHRKDKKFMKWFRSVKIVVVDELHEQMSRRNFKLLETIKPAARIGLTATLQLKRKPVRMRAYAFSGPVIYEFPYAEGRKRGVVAAGRAVQFLLPEISDSVDQGAYEDAYMEEIVENRLKCAVCVAIVEELIEVGRCVIILVRRREHVAVLHKAFSHVPHKLAFGGVARAKRASSQAEFEAGKINLIIASVVFKKGVSIDRVTAIVDVAEMKSENDAQQKFGRGVRLHKDKTDLLYIDIGTRGGRFLRNSRRRLRALKALDLPVASHKVSTVEKTLRFLKRYL